MNVTFHVLGSLATAAVLNLKPNEKIWNLPKLAAGFFAGILVHGVLDFLPHNYPLPAKIDVGFALFLLAAAFFTARKQNRFLLLVCFGGALFPDLVDLSAGIINKHLGIPISPLPFKIFPWHRKVYSGSIYDGSRKFESTIYHISVLLICL
ncbi:MAG TPA: hypothetical protein VF599_17560, partial [Pyrinomonadaceae bacterium]